MKDKRKVKNENLLAEPEVDRAGKKECLGPGGVTSIGNGAR
jgi:hypothetical protein